MSPDSPHPAPAPGALWPALPPSPQPRPVQWTGLKGVREGAAWDSGRTAPNGRTRRSCREAQGGGWQGGAPGSPASVPRCPSCQGARAPHLCSAASPHRPAAGGPRGPRGSGLGRAALTVRVGQDAERRPGGGAVGDSLTGHGVWQERAQRHRAAGGGQSVVCDWPCSPALLQASAALAERPGASLPEPDRAGESP